METRLTKCYAIWIRTKEEGKPSFFGGGKYVAFEMEKYSFN